MKEKVAVQLDKVQETLLLPLWGRAVEARRPNPLLIDEKASEIIENINYDFSVITENMNKLSQLAWVARCLQIDRMLSEFIEEHPRATIINVGCGMDTTFDRIDNGQIMFYELDLPDVIALREQFFEPDPRRKTIACSFLNSSWLDEVEVEDGLFCIAAGVLYYYDEHQIKDFFKKMAETFGRCDFAFDFLSPFGVKMGNKKVLEAGGMNEATLVKSWGVERAAGLEAWDSGIKILEDIPMHHGLKKKYPLGMKLAAGLTDMIKPATMVHLTVTC